MFVIVALGSLSFLGFRWFTPGFHPIWRILELIAAFAMVLSLPIAGEQLEKYEAEGLPGLRM